MSFLSKSITMLLFLAVFAVAVHAQPGGGGDPGSGEPVPISGLGILIALGSLLGLWRFSAKRKN